jgi:hypothetical protein
MQEKFLVNSALQAHVWAVPVTVIRQTLFFLAIFLPQAPASHPEELQFCFSEEPFSCFVVLSQRYVPYVHWIMSRDPITGLSRSLIRR